MSRFYVQCSWEEAAHLGPEAIAELTASVEPHLLEARSKGIPAMGAGMVYPVQEAFITAPDDFRLKPWFRRCYGLDVGWNATAAVWMAYDPDNDTIYIYDCYMQGKRDPTEHAAAIMRRDPPGMKLAGAIDPASSGSGQADGKQLLKLYRAAGLKVIPADNTRESAFHDIYGYMAAGKFKVVKTPNTEPWFREYRTFVRNDKGKINNESDFHLQAATRYAFMTGLKAAAPLPVDHTHEHVIGSVNYGI
jgi:hypothetical protein